MAFKLCGCSLASLARGSLLIYILYIRSSIILFITWKLCCTSTWSYGERAMRRSERESETWYTLYMATKTSLHDPKYDFCLLSYLWIIVIYGFNVGFQNSQWIKCIWSICSFDIIHLLPRFDLGARTLPYHKYCHCVRSFQWGKWTPVWMEKTHYT